MEVSIIYTPYHRLHVGTGPEKPERIEAIISTLKLNPDITDFSPATENQILRVHDQSFLHLIKYMDKNAKSISQYLDIASKDERIHQILNGTVVVHGSYLAGRYAAGAVIRALKEDYPNLYLLIRPPSHHSHRGYTHGFCLFNNTCIGLYNQNPGKTLIVDLDLHYGDGVASITRGNPQIEYMSLGFLRPEEAEPRPTLNRIEETYKSFKPDLVYFIMGYDALDFDYITLEKFKVILKKLLKITRNSRRIFELSGGYNLNWLPIWFKETLTLLAETK